MRWFEDIEKEAQLFAQYGLIDAAKEIRKERQPKKLILSTAIQDVGVETLIEIFEEKPKDFAKWGYYLALYFRERLTEEQIDHLAELIRSNHPYWWYLFAENVEDLTAKKKSQLDSLPIIP